MNMKLIKTKTNNQPVQKSKGRMEKAKKKKQAVSFQQENEGGSIRRMAQNIP